MAWKNDLRSIFENTGERVTALARAAPKEEKLTLPLFILICVMTIALVGAIVWKKGEASPIPYDWPQPPLTQPVQPVPVPPQPQPEPQPQPRPDFSPRPYPDQNLQEATRKIWERVKWNTDILTLMSIVNNHNTAVSQNGYSKSHYLYINEDWTIDRLPHHLQLTDEDKEFLRKFVKRI